MLGCKVGDGATVYRIEGPFNQTPTTAVEERCYYTLVIYLNGSEGPLTALSSSLGPLLKQDCVNISLKEK